MVEITSTVSILKINDRSIPTGTTPKLTFKTSWLDAAIVTIEFNGTKLNVDKRDLQRAVVGLMG